MNIQEVNKLFIIYRGLNRSARSYFCFFVDGDSSSWSKHQFLAARFRSRTDAEIAIAKLKERQRDRAKARKAEAIR